MRRSKIRLLAAAFFFAMAGAAALASGPRYVTGPPFFPGTQSLPIGWKQANLLYSTDPGNLSASVPHAAADALVAAAAGVWNLPVASITLGPGKPLAEHVSSANVYLDSSGVQYPADVMSSNEVAVPIAVIYDTDGSVTDTLLGAGASGPTSCNSNAVTSTVDSFDPAGYILHAVIILNGRCTGPIAAQQLQMQYKLERAFGRVLGLAWSQANDNVFTGKPTPTYNQALHWPIMHPIDILCGPYSYQCLPNPFTLRPDDIASMVIVYPIGPNATVPAGKQVSLAAANGVSGSVTFPDGQGMAGVNVLAKRQELNLPLDAWDEVSVVTGSQFRRGDSSPFVAAGTSALASMGTLSQQFAGEYVMAYIPLDAGHNFSNLTVFTEPVNPLYRGAYSLGPYGLNAVAPSGSAPASLTFPGVPATYSVGLSFPIADAASACGTGLDGVAAAPAQVAATGWWQANLCGYGHASYLSADIKPGHSFTVEATALDANGLATTTKAMPVIGLYGPGDAIGQPGSLPTLGVAASAFQGLAYGTTVLGGSIAPTSPMTRITLGVADERGDGRPDYPYQGRLFYADNIEPAQVPATGGTVTITGMGFRMGNTLLVNGVAANVTQWSASAVVATVPTMTAAHASNGIAVDVEMLDRGTGATSIITGGFSYSGAATLPNAMILLSAPTGTLPVGLQAAVPLSVRVVGPDGVTPVAGDKITFSATAGSVTFGCGVSPCSLLTDAGGTATTSVMPLAEGGVMLQAADGRLLQTAGFTAQSQPTSMAVLRAPEGSFAVGTSINSPFIVRVYGPDGSTGLLNQRITFTIAGGAAVYTPCNTPVCTATTDAYGICVIYVTPTGPGTVTLQAADDALSQQASFTATQDVDSMLVLSKPGANGFVGQSDGSFGIQLLRGDGVTGDYGELVTFTLSPGVVMSGCGGSTCRLYTNSGGVISNSVSANVAGTFTVQATYGALTQTVSFSVSTRSLSFKILSVPAGNIPIGAVAPAPFTAQLLAPDGVTPLSGYIVVISGPEGEVLLQACHSFSCTLGTDQNGMVSTLVTPLVAGTIPLDAIYPPVVASTSVIGIAPTDSLTVVTQPGGSIVHPGDNVALRVQLLQQDGATPDAAKTVTYTVTSGSFSFSGCGAASCAIATDTRGMAAISGVAGASGAVVVTATYGSLSVSMSFTVTARPNVLQIVSSPSSGAYVGVAAAQTFSVRVLLADGTTPVAGEHVTITVTNGSAGLAGCGGATSCVLQADSSGIVSTLVTPLAAGSITFQAADGNVTQSVTFTAISRPDSLRLVSAPADGSYAGTVATGALTLQVLLGDGLTPAAGEKVTFAVTNGSAFLLACNGAASCVLTTDAQGMVSSAVRPLAAGPITLQAADGLITQTATFVAVDRPDTLLVQSKPADGSVAGTVAALPFAVQVLAGDGSKAKGRSVSVAVTNGVLAACAASSCVLASDSGGLVSTGVTPLRAGVVTLVASEGGVSASVSFNASAGPDVLTALSVPANGSLAGDPAALPFAVKVVTYDGFAAAGRSVTVSVTNARLAACGASTCLLVADNSGRVATEVTPLAAGVVSLVASDGGVMLSASFSATPKPDLLQVIQTPGASVFAEATATTPFAVRVLLADGVTPAAGVSVTFASAGGGAGSVQFGACGAASCVVVSDASGTALTRVTGLSAGAVTLIATADAASGAGSVSWALQVVPNADNLNPLEAMTYVAEGVRVQASFTVAASSNGAAAPALPIVWKGAGGITLGAVEASTDSGGLATAQVTLGPLGAGGAGAATACAWVGVCASFRVAGVAQTELQIAIASGGQQAVTSGAAPAPVVAQVIDGAGHPVAGAAVTIYQTVTALTLDCPAQGRCPAQPTIASKVTVAMSALDGSVSVAPMLVLGTATQTSMAFAVGSAGFATALVTSRP